MIEILVDEAYAYDMLSILEIKLSKKHDDDNFNNFIRLNNRLANHSGSHKKILDSQEYSELYQTNLALFNYIDKIKTNPCIEDGVWVDNMNYQRFVYKKQLQEKFFPSNKITEQKLGY